MRFHVIIDRYLRFSNVFLSCNLTVMIRSPRDHRGCIGSKTLSIYSPWKSCRVNFEYVLQKCWWFFLVCYLPYFAAALAAAA